MSGQSAPRPPGEFCFAVADAITAGNPNRPKQTIWSTISNNLTLRGLQPAPAVLGLGFARGALL
jgi:hypothetical protein